MASITWDSIITLHSNSSYNTNCCQINDNLIAAVYRVGANQYIDIIEFSGDSYEVLSHTGTDTLLQSARDNYQAICKVTDNKFAVAYNRNGDVRVHLYYWNGSSLIDYGEDLGSGADSDYHELVQIEDNKIMLFFRSSDEMKAIVATCNDGVSLTWGNFYVPVAYNLSYISAVKIGSGKVMCAFRNSGATDLEVMVLSSPAGLSDRTISYGAVYDIETNLVTYYISTASYENDRAIVTYGVSGASYGYAVACSISGTVIDIGTRKDFESGETLNTSVAKCHAVEDAFLVAYEDANDSHKGKTRELIVNWDTKVITLGDLQTFSENSIGGGFDNEALALISTDNGNYCITFCDVTDGDYAKVIMDIIIIIPDPPTGISVEEGEGQNTITFTPDGEADSTHIYWANSPGVTKGTGTKISSVSSPYVHDDLNPSLDYYYVLTSENENGEGDESSEYSGSSYPEAPTNINAVAGTEQITITWDSAIGADSYNIYWANSPGVTKGTGTKITGVTSPHVHSSLIPGQPYYYVVTSEDEDGESSESSEVNETPHLSIPDNVDANLSDSLEITVTWDSVYGATKYNIYWAKSPGVTKETGTKIADVTSPYVHGSLDDGDTYYYVVTAENALEETDESSEVNALATDAIDPPSVVSAIATDIQEITLSWSDVSDADSYNVYYATIHGVSQEIGVKIEDITSPYIFNAPIADINYYFVITSVHSVLGESDDSDEVYALSIPPIPDAPSSVVATAGDALVNLTWTPPSYSDTYNIYWGLAPGITKETGTKITGVTSPYSFAVPALYQAYYFVITAVNESGESDESSEVFATPDPIIPNPPENLSGEGTDTGEITLTWDAADYAVTYNVYYGRLPNITKTNSSKIEGVADVTKAISSLITGRTYYFAVTSINPEGESDLSEEISVVALIDLTGTSVAYLKATAEYNNIILEWSNLEGATSYNIYWSKTSPVDTGTANKIEGVSSPYRHYITIADDPIYVVVGNNDLGESDVSEEASAIPKEVSFNSINFLPENIREYPLFMEFCGIFDYVISKYHYENVDKLAGLFDAVHDDFDPDYVLGLIGAEYFFNFDLTTDQKKALCLMLSNLYDMKGTKKGLDYILRLIGLDATVYEWYNINLGLYPEIPETVDPCSIVLDLGLGDHPLLSEEESKFVELANYLLWVCVKLHGIFWSKKFEDWFEGIEDEIYDIEMEDNTFNKYCAWQYNYPGLIIIGGAVVPHPVFIGETGLKIGDFYFEGEPLVIGSDAEVGADYDGVCDPHFIGEPGYYIGDGEEDDGLSQLTWVIDET